MLVRGLYFRDSKKKEVYRNGKWVAAATVPGLNAVLGRKAGAAAAGGAAASGPQDMVNDEPTEGPDNIEALPLAARRQLMKRAVSKAANREFNKFVKYFLNNYNSGTPQLTLGIKRGKVRYDADKDVPWNSVALGITSRRLSDDNYNPEPGRQTEQPESRSGGASRAIPGVTTSVSNAQLANVP